MKRRIALVTYALKRGGMETFLLQLGRYMQHAGCDVEIITTEEKGEWFARAAEFGLAAHHYGPENDSAPVSALMHVWRIGRKLAKSRYDVVFLNHARYAQAGLGLLGQKTFVVPILHNTFDEIFAVGCSNENKWNVLVAVSPLVAEVAARRVPRRAVVTIPNGVRIPSEAIIRERRPLDKALRLTYLGRLEHQQKGVLLMPGILEGCLRRGIDCSLEIVGDGPDRGLLEDQLQQRGLEGRYRLRGPVDGDDVYGLLLQSHMLLLPSFFEGLPLALLEAQACGCVPVASLLTGCTNYAVQSGSDGVLVRPGAIDAFVDAIATLYENPSRWHAMSAEAHNTARRRFSIDAMGAAYQDLMADLFAGQYPRPAIRRSVPCDMSLFSWRDSIPAPVRRIKRAFKRRLSRSKS